MTSAISKEWGAPAPLSPPDSHVPALARDMLPQPMADYIEDISQRLSISLDLPAGAVLATVGAAVGRSIQIQPQAPGNPWTIPPNLWCCLIAESGWGKSPVISAALKPLFDIQAHYNRQNTEATKHHTALIRAYKRSADEGGESPEPPALKRLYTNNSTAEALHNIARDNPRGLLLLTDELPKLWDALDSPSNSQAKGFFLQSWNGNDEITLDRIGRGQNLSAVVCLSQLGGAQPDLVDRYLRGMEADGWIQRFGLMLYPNLSSAYVLNRTAENRRAREVMDRLIDGLCNLRAAEMRVVQFDSDVQTLYDRWLESLVNRQRFSDEDPALVSHFVKFQSLMPQLALSFEIAKNPAANTVGAASTELALRWVRGYLDAHAKRVYGLTERGGDSPYQLAAAIQQHKLHSPFSVRDVRQLHWRGLGGDWEINEAIDTLVGWGWLRAADSAAGTGRPTVKYAINPNIPRM
jgi:putative DNA primase/helicase